MQTSLATNNVFPIHAFPKLAEDRIKTSTIDPVLLLWQQLSEKRIISDEMLNAAHEKIKTLPEEIIYPEVVCHFPDFKGLPTHGMKPQEQMVISCAAEASKAAAIAKARASYYGKAEQKEAERLGNKWTKEISEAIEKAEMLKDVLGYTELSEKSDELYAEAKLLRQKLLDTQAESIKGVLIQVTEMIQYIHYNNYQESADQLTIIESGLKDLL